MRMLLRNYKFVVPVAISLFYLISNLQFLYGLDDSVNYVNMQKHGIGSTAELLKFISKIFTPPPPEAILFVYRPLRVTHTFVSSYYSQYVSFLPDIVNALSAGMLCDRVIWIDEHVVRMSGNTKEVVSKYEETEDNAELLRDVKGNL